MLYKVTSLTAAKIFFHNFLKNWFLNFKFHSDQTILTRTKPGLFEILEISFWQMTKPFERLQLVLARRHAAKKGAGGEARGTSWRWKGQRQRESCQSQSCRASYSALAWCRKCGSDVRLCFLFFYGRSDGKQSHQRIYFQIHHHNHQLNDWSSENLKDYYSNYFWGLRHLSTNITGQVPSTTWMPWTLQPTALSSWPRRLGLEFKMKNRWP